MKKQLLSILFGAAALSASAQMNDAGTGLTLTNSNWQSNCYANLAPGNGGIMAHGTSFNDGPNYIASQLGPYVFVSKSDIESTSATWFSIPIVVGEDSTAQCSSLFTEDTGIDMSSNGKVSFTAEASEAGAVLQFFLGSTGQWYPGSSTFSSDIIVAHTFAEANVQETFTLDLSTEIGWSDWAGSAKVQSMGFRSQTPSATFSVYEIKLGADADSDNTDGGGNTDGDDNSDGNQGNGSECSSLNDKGHGTWYNNLDVSESAVVKCSFERSDILGTKYGALDKGLLLEDGTAKYCGMCVEAIAPEHNNKPVIIQIVDECPDCYDRGPNGENLSPSNTKFGDIDLSISAFKALLSDDHVSLGIGDFNWKEVACPWENPLHIIVQGSNQWGVKVIVGNHVNRVAKVEVAQAGTYYELQRGVDNGWTSYHLAEGTLNEIDKTFKVTDIYGSEVEVSGIDFSDNNTNSKTIGSSNFAPCGLVTSNGLPNELDYVIAFPNPANTQVTFEGISEANTIEILNVNGQVVASRILNSQFAQVTLDISELTSGIYVAKMVGSSNTGAVTFVKK